MSAKSRLRILFVDDDARLLDGLRRAMRDYRARWDADFALGAGEAMSRLNAESADIVITDMRMPGMDGALLLAEIAIAHPRTMRIVLTGQTHASAARRAMRVAHQILAKPIAAPALAETIGRLDAVRGLLGDDDLRRRATSACVLPPLPSLYRELEQLCDAPAATAADFARVIGRDPAMTAKLLQLGGSPFFGCAAGLTGIEQIVSQVGLDTLRAVVCDGQLAAAPGGDAAAAAEIALHQRHSLLVARVARRIVPDRSLADDAYAAGLLHDVGKLFVLGQAGHAHDDHAAVGAYLLGIWGLPWSVVAAVASHHAPDSPLGGDSLGAVVRAASALAHECLDDSAWTWPESLDSSVLDVALIRESMAAWRAIAAEECAAMMIRS